MALLLLWRFAATIGRFKRFVEPDHVIVNPIRIHDEGMQGRHPEGRQQVRIVEWAPKACETL
jgi:hypothetical protein